MDILKCVLGLILLQGQGWFIVEIFILYIVFYMVFKLIKKQDIAMILLCAAAVAMIFIGNSNGRDNTGIGDYWFHGEWWYNSTIVFVMGVLFARFTNQIQKFTKRIYRYILPISLVLFYFAFQYEEKVMKRYGYFMISFRIGGVDPKVVSLHAQIGDEVYLGRYDTNYLSPGDERVTWIVLDIVDDKVMLISKEGLAGSSYCQKHMEVTWDDSTLWSLLNEKMLEAMFSSDELSMIIPNPETEDYLSVLSVSEAETLFADDSSRQLIITKTAWKEGANQNAMSKVKGWDMKDYSTSWWWLRGEDYSIKAPVVTVDGEIVEDKIYVNRADGAVRPVVWVQVGETP